MKKSGLWRSVSPNRKLSERSSWRREARFFDPMVPTNGIYLKLQATKDPNETKIFKGLDFDPEDFQGVRIGFGRGNESLPKELYDLVQKNSDLTKMYSAIGMYQQRALLEAVQQQTMDNPISFRTGVLFCNGRYRVRSAEDRAFTGECHGIQNE